MLSGLQGLVPDIFRDSAESLSDKYPQPLNHPGLACDPGASGPVECRELIMRLGATVPKIRKGGAMCGSKIHRDGILVVKAMG